ncbi:MAG TPA: phosphopantetheine-binding protein, partial [bacterium]|nr:phosphopantetheine-binding protein [bacterium]
FVQPETDIEKTIADVWKEALDTDRVGLDDNFFDLGGNSLRIIQVHMKLRDRVKKELALVDLFRFPTIRALSGSLSQGDESRPEMSGTASRADTRRALRNRRLQNR